MEVTDSPRWAYGALAVLMIAFLAWKPLKSPFGFIVTFAIGYWLIGTYIYPLPMPRFR